jgi:hypothetical protein
MEYLDFAKYVDREDKLLVCGFDEIYAHRPLTLTVTECFVTLTQFIERIARVHEADLLELRAENTLLSPLQS